MARIARREPSNQELDERLTRLEHHVAEIATTVTQANKAAVNEIHAFRTAVVEHRDEARKAFSSTHELIIRLHAELQAEVRNDRLLANQRHAEIMAQFEKLTIRPAEN
jgi:hypothetical protein